MAKTHMERGFENVRKNGRQAAQMLRILIESCKTSEYGMPAERSYTDWAKMLGYTSPRHVAKAAAVLTWFAVQTQTPPMSVYAVRASGENEGLPGEGVFEKYLTKVVPVDLSSKKARKDLLSGIKKAAAAAMLGVKGSKEFKVDGTVLHMEFNQFPDVITDEYVMEMANRNVATWGC